MCKNLGDTDTPFLKKTCLMLHVNIQVSLVTLSTGSNYSFHKEKAKVVEPSGPVVSGMHTCCFCVCYGIIHMLRQSCSDHVLVILSLL